MNSAVALGELGADAHFLGRLSRDAFGRQLRSHILGANVQLDLATESSQATSIAVVSLDEEGVASYTFHFHDTANFGWQVDDLPQLAGRRLAAHRLTVLRGQPGGRGAAGLDARGAVRGVVRHQRAPDGDHRPRGLLGQGAAVAAGARAARRASSRPATRTSPFLAQAPAVQADAGDLRSGGAGRSWVEQYGLGLGVITLGPGGGAAVEPGGRTTRVPGYPTKVVDTVGAGDTFMAGFLDARISLGLDLESSLRRAAAAASIDCSRQGAQPPTSAEVDELIATASGGLIAGSLRRPFFIPIARMKVGFD